MSSKSLKTLFKSLCLILVMVFVMTGIFFIGKAFAAGLSTPPVQTEVADNASLSQADGINKASMKGVEDISKRDNNNKHFTLEDGTKEAVIFGYPVHYLDNGEYKEIDNNLILSKNKDGQEIYTNKANSFQAEISPNSDRAGISTGKYRLTWTIDGISKKAGGGVQPSLTKQQWESQNEASKRTTVPNIGSSITYKEILSNVDLNYAVVSDQFKESIIINSLTDISTITEQVKAENLKLIKNDDGTILAQDENTGDTIFVLPAPFMFDSNGEISNNISVDISSSGNTYILTYTLDKEWLKSAAYPVVVDPTISVYTGATYGATVDDNHVSQASSTKNYQNGDLMCTGYGSSSHIDRSYIRFNQLPSISPSQIYGAHLSLITFSTFNDSSTVEIHKVTAPWSASTLNYSNQPSFDPAVATSLYVTGPCGIGVTKTWNGNGVSAGLTQLVRGWYSTNYGMVLKDSNESSSANFYKCWYTWNYRVNHSGSGYNGPTMTIDYDDVAPSAPSSISTSPSGWTNNTSPTVYWSGITDGGGSGLAYVQILVDGGLYDNVGNTGGYTFNASGWSEGAHTISVRGVDNVGNVGGVASTIYYKDTSAAPPSNITVTPSNWSKTQTLNYTAPSDLSGIKRYEYESDNNGSWNPLPVNFLEGSHTLRLRSVDNAGNTSGPSLSVPYKKDTTAPKTPNPPRITVEDGPLNNGAKAKITISFDTVIDNPVGTPAITDYRLMKSTDNVNFTQIGQQSSSPFVLTDQADNSTFYFKIRAYDSLGYYSESASTRCNTLDRTGPVIIATNISISPDTSATNAWTSVDPTISWQNISDAGDGTSGIRYKIDNDGGWTPNPAISAIPYGNGHYVIPGSSFTDGPHTIYIRAEDSVGNVSNVMSLTYKKDTTINPTNVKIEMPLMDHVVTKDSNGNVIIKAKASDEHLKDWKLEYALGTSPLEADYVGHLIASGNSTLLNTTENSWNISDLEQNRIYTIRLSVTDFAENKATNSIRVLYAVDANYVDPILTQTLKDNSNNIIAPSDDIAVDNVNAFYSPSIGRLGTLYANDEVKDAESAGNMGLSFNPLEYDSVNNRWVYPEGSQVFIRTMTQDGSNKYDFSNHTYEGHNISDPFESDTGISSYDSDSTTRVDGHIELAANVLDGSFTSTEQVINGRISYVDLTVDAEKPAGTTIEYRLIYGSGPNDYVVLVPGKTTLNLPVNSYYLKAILHRSNTSVVPKVNAWYLETMYVAFGDSIVVNNSFEDNGRGFCDLDKVIHNEVGGSMELAPLPEPQTGFEASGTFKSTIRVTPGKVWEAHLQVSETVDTSHTEIQYSISTNGGINWYPIEPGSNPNSDTWVSIPAEALGNQIVLKAELTGDGLHTPALNSWVLRCRQTLAGEAHDVKIIDEPDELSTLVDANYMTLLRWQPSETEGVTYNVYRSTTPYFDVATSTPIAVGISESYWSDYNLNYGQRFYYKVTAVKTFGEHVRESLPSNEAWADVVSQNELSKRLGLQDYWTYSGFRTGNGTGYVNISNGNLAFNSTDIAIPGPFFGMVMRRTYNLMANTKTPMGYGWDYSFNTCLFKEYEDDGVTVRAVILKDGDGSFHRFKKVDGVYQSAKGSFMTLTYDEQEYRIKRKDDITYHFNAANMKLISFTDLNGVALEFLYDERGNLKTVTNEVRESLSFEYNVDGAEIEDPDYIYVNNNIDMLKSITWTQNAQTNPVSLIYNYVYDEEDRLVAVHTPLSGTNVCVASFDYNVDLDGDPTTMDRNVVITDGEGKKTVTLYNEDGSVTKIYDPVENLSELSTAHYNSFAYEALEGDDKTSITTDLGLTTQYFYDGNGMHTRYVNSAGQYIAYTNDEDDPLTPDIDEADLLTKSMEYQNTINGVEKIIRFTYDYDDNGNVTLVKAWDKLAGTQNFTALGPETVYTYDANFPNKVKTKSVKKDSSGPYVVTSYDYNADGSLHLMSVADDTADEKQTEYQYYTGEEGGLRYQLKSVEDQFDKETRYVYNTKGQLIHTDEYDAQDNYVRTVSTFDYDGYGYTKTVTDAYDRFAQNPVCNVTNMKYDEWGRLVETINPDKTATIWEYDLNGNTTSVQTGTMSGSTFGKRNETVSSYDSLDRLISSTILNGPETSDDVTSSVSYQKWDSTPEIAGSESDKIVKTDPVGVQTIEYYNSIGQLVKTQTYDGTNHLTTAEYAYDEVGNLIQTTDGAGRIGKVFYNELNQKVRTVVDPFVSGETDHLNLENIYDYDYLGNKLSDTQRSYADPQNHTDYTTTYTYDVLSRLVSVSQQNPNYGQPGEPQYLTTRYEYDYEETVNGQALIRNTSIDAMNRIQDTYFDEMGRKKLDINYGDVTWNQGVPDRANDPVKKTTSYDEYDRNHRPKWITRVDGSREEYSYDEMGRVEWTKYYPNGSQTATDTIAYDYNEYGELKEEALTQATGTQTTSYQYDLMGRVENVWDGVIGSGGLDLTYVYNKDGQIKDLEYKTLGTNIHHLNYVYDGYGRISEIRLDPVSGDDNTVRKYFYKTNGDLDYEETYREFNSNGTDIIRTAYEFNKAGKTKQITISDTDLIDTSNPGGVTERYTANYNGRGYIDLETLETDYSTSSGITTTYKGYQYDTIGRLIKAGTGANNPSSWDQWESKTEYKYDGVGNRKSMIIGADETKYEYSDYNQLTTVRNKDDVVIESYGYDERGNLDYVEKFNNGTTTEYDDYTFDLLNRLAETKVNNCSLNYDETTKNFYNASGQRIGKEIWNDQSGTMERTEATKYFYTGSSVLYTVSEEGKIKTENVLDLSGSIVASWRDRELGSQQVYLYNYDIRGSVTNVVKTDGFQETGYAYDEFGNTEVSGNTNFLNETGYTGSILDNSTGMMYMNSRFYDPKTGRFLSQDTYTGNAYEPWTQHLYSYCGNNPTNFTDPTGHRWDIDGDGTYVVGSPTEDMFVVQKRQQAKKKKKPAITITLYASNLNNGVTIDDIRKDAHEAQNLLNNVESPEYSFTIDVKEGVGSEEYIKGSGQVSIQIVETYQARVSSYVENQSQGAISQRIIGLYVRGDSRHVNGVVLIEEMTHSVGMFEEHYKDEGQGYKYCNRSPCKFAGTAFAETEKNESSIINNVINKALGDCVMGGTKVYNPCP